MGSKSQGMALVIVLFILAIMTVTAVWLVDTMMITIRRTENIRDAEQAHQIAVASEMWGVLVLERDGREGATDHLAESWNHLGTGVSIDEGTVETVIIDQQGLFNINNLFAEVELGLTPSRRQSKTINADWTPAFRRLLILLELDPALSDAVLDWLDADQNVRGAKGAEDHDYLLKKPAYRAANRMFTDISELIWVQGFDEKILTRLSPYISALPATGVRININTAPLMILRILAPTTLSEQEAQSLIDGRPQQEGYSIDTFLNHPVIADKNQIAARIAGDSSRYFNIKNTVHYGRAKYHMTSLVNRVGDLASVLVRR